MWFTYSSLSIDAEALNKKQMKAATEEKAHMRKEKQANNQAKAAERERRQNQENIRKSCFPVPRCYPSVHF